jgi:hypothetical protein
VPIYTPSLLTYSLYLLYCIVKNDDKRNTHRKAHTMTAKATATRPSPRISFNWGFHDAQWEAERQMPRIVVQYGDQSTKQVSHTFDHYYATGYAAGIDAYKRIGTRLQTSEPAWEAYRNSLVGSEPDALFEAIYEAEKAELRDCLRLKKLEHRHLEQCRDSAKRAYWGDAVNTYQPA